MSDERRKQFCFIIFQKSTVTGIKMTHLNIGQFFLVGYGQTAITKGLLRSFLVKRHHATNGQCWTRQLQTMVVMWVGFFVWHFKFNKNFILTTTVFFTVGFDRKTIMQQKFAVAFFAVAVHDLLARGYSG